jgi:hypothetical protein
MSQQSPKPDPGRRSPNAVGELITDPVELARIEANRPPDDGGVERMVFAALEIAVDREARGKPVNLGGAAFALFRELNQDQQLAFVRGLPDVLTDEARHELEQRLRPGK